MEEETNILAWRISWSEEPGRLHSPWGGIESDTTAHLRHTGIDGGCFVAVVVLVLLLLFFSS